MRLNNIFRQIPSWIKLILKLIILVIIVFLILRNLDERAWMETLSQIHPVWIVWGLIWFTFSKLLSAIRYHFFLQNEGVQISSGDNLKLYWLGMYYNLLLPGGISGDAYKVKKLQEVSGAHLRQLIVITIADRISGLLALGILGVLLMVFIPGLYPFILWVMPAVPFMIYISWIAFKRWMGKNTALWLKSHVLSFGVQAFQCIAVIGFVYALGEIPHWIDYTILFLLSSLVAMVPFTIGGAGARELTFFFGAQWMQVEIEKAVAVAFLFYVVSTLVSLTGMAFGFSKKKLFT